MRTPSLVCLTLGIVTSKGCLTLGARDAIGDVWASPMGSGPKKNESPSFRNSCLYSYKGFVVVNFKVRLLRRRLVGFPTKPFNVSPSPVYFALSNSME